MSLLLDTLEAHFSIGMDVPVALRDGKLGLRREAWYKSWVSRCFCWHICISHVFQFYELRFLIFPSIQKFSVMKRIIQLLQVHHWGDATGHQPLIKNSGTVATTEQNNQICIVPSFVWLSYIQTSKAIYSHLWEKFLMPGFYRRCRLCSFVLKQQLPLLESKCVEWYHRYIPLEPTAGSLSSATRKGHPHNLRLAQSSAHLPIH